MQKHQIPRGASGRRVSERQVMPMPERITKHKLAQPPLLCSHCGYMWYGRFHTHLSVEEHPFCWNCYSTLDTYLESICHVASNQSDEYYEKVFRDLRPAALAWIADQTKAPLPRKRRFHSSVPHWMRNAILQGPVQPGSDLIYTIFSQGHTFVKAELVTKASTPGINTNS